jgi:nicotinate-nucleotide adenylyltransferase
LAIAILGGGYNPPTVAYEEIIRLVLCQKEIRSVWLMPYYERAFGKAMTVSSRERFAMAELLASHAGSRVKASDLELRQQRRTYTIETQKRLMEQNPEEQFVWIIGSDLLPELEQWQEIDELCRLTRFLCIHRPDFDVDPVWLKRYPILQTINLGDKFNVSSSRVRELAFRGQSIDNWVPPYIAEYIYERRIYDEKILSTKHQ